MGKFIFCIFFVLGVIKSYSQSTLNASGNTDTSSSFIISSSVGSITIQNEVVDSIETFEGVLIPNEILIPTTVKETRELSGKLTLSVYPNPTQSIIYINSIDTIGELRLSVYDSNGKLLKNFDSKLPFQLDLTNYSSGNYVLKATYNGNFNFINIIKSN
jgi:hypothetical protein